MNIPRSQRLFQITLHLLKNGGYDEYLNSKQIEYFIHELTNSPDLSYQRGIVISLSILLTENKEK